MLKFHHMGLIVESIDSAVKTYSCGVFPSQKPEKINISSQGVNVALFRVGDSAFVEFIEAAGALSAIDAFKRRAGCGYYHAAYTSVDLPCDLTVLENAGFTRLAEFDSEAFDGRKCVFLMSPDMHLIELIAA